MSEKNEWKLAEALRESLLWTASSLAAVGKEQDVIVLEGRKRTIGEILDEANAALDTPSAPGDAQDEPIGTLSRNADETIRFTPARDFHVKDGMPVFSTPAAGDARAALRELVACDNLKKQIASMQVCVMETDDDVQELGAMMSDLARRQPAAWDAARSALAAQVPQRGEA